MESNISYEQISIVAGVIGILSAGLKGWWVFGWVHERFVKEITASFENQMLLLDERARRAETAEQYWQNIALRLADISEKTTNLAEHSTTKDRP
jgi:hypothetical protein